MKKTISITINKMVFNIEEDAYNRLNSYLEDLKKHFGSAEYGSEVVNDIESRISEQLNNKMKDRKSEVVTISEVEEVIKTMGTVEDVTGEAKTSSEPERTKSGSRRLYRNPDDQIVAGVSSGIASYFNIDPLIPRLLFVVATLAGGYGILLYIIMWIIVPEAQTPSAKLEMKGDPVTVANLEESRKEKKTENFSLIRYFFKEVFYLIGRFFRALGPAILTIIGLFMTAVSFVAMFGVALVALILLFNPNSTYIDPAITQVFNGGDYILVVIAAFVAAIIPIITALLIGTSFVRRKNIFNSKLVIVFVIVWLSGALTFGLMASSAAPQIQAAVRSVEEQPSASKEFSVDNFSIVRAESDQNVKIIYGTQRKVVVYGSEEEVNNMSLTVENNRLTMRQTDHDFRICFICINRPLRLEITTPSLVEVEARNASHVELIGFNDKLNSLNIDGSGAARIKFSGKLEQLTVDLSNASRLELMGSATQSDLQLNNASRVIAEDFVVTNMKIEAEHSSHADINVTGRLEADASDASRITYRGNPIEEILETSNVGRITER